jgi:hypothetical protein
VKENLQMFQLKGALSAACRSVDCNVELQWIITKEIQKSPMGIILQMGLH